MNSSGWPTHPCQAMGAIFEILSVFDMIQSAKASGKQRRRFDANGMA